MKRNGPAEEADTPQPKQARVQMLALEGHHVVENLKNTLFGEKRKQLKLSVAREL